MDFSCTHCLLLLPRLHGRFVFLELVTPVGVNFLIVIAFVRWRTSGVRKEIQLFLCAIFQCAFGNCTSGKKLAAHEGKWLAIHHRMFFFPMSLTYEHLLWCCNYTITSHPNGNHIVRHRLHWQKPPRDHVRLYQYILLDYISLRSCWSLTQNADTKKMVWWNIPRRERKKGQKIY
jgi:hypothetical protein